jgi:hypothetical protein
MSSWRLLPLSLAALLAACGEAPKVQPPVMALSATSLAFSASLGGAAPAAQQVTISNGGGGTLGAPLPEIFYGSGSGWLADVTVTGGAAPYTLSVRPSLGALAAGTYVATVRLATVSATNSPQAVTVTLQVRPGMQVTRRITSWGEDGAGSTVAPGDVTAVALLQDDGAGGTIRTDLTESSSPGTWVAEAPTGPWWAQVAWADGRVGYYRGSGLTLDLGEDEGGRAGRTSPTAATFVVPNLNGLDPWDDNGITYDTLVFYAWGAQASGAIADGSPPDFPLFGGETSVS